MTDFIFFNDSGNVRVTLRTDQVSNSSSTSSNITVMQITGLDEGVSAINKQKMLTLFKKLPLSAGDLASFATAHKLNLTAVDSSGNSTALVASNASTSS